MNRLPRVISLFVFFSAALFAIDKPVSAADPTIAECLTANDKSISLRNEHKLLAARKELLVCAASTCPAEVRKECMRRIDLVNTSLPTVVLEAKDGAGNDLSAVKVTMDGDVLVEKLDGSSISLDPGAHTFTFEVAGQPPLTKQLVIREGQKDRREVLQFGAPAAAMPATAPVAKTGPNPAIETSVDHVSSSAGGTQRIVALVAAGVGVAGVGVGTIFGLQSMSKHSDASAKCPGACSDQAGVELWNDARSSGNISTIAFAVGGVGLVTGAILWFTAKTPSRTTALQADIGPGSVQIRGSW